MLLSLEGGDIKRDDKDVLPRQKCLDALAALRHAKWFQVHSPTLPNVCALHHPPRFKNNCNNSSHSNMSYDNFDSSHMFYSKMTKVVHSYSVELRRSKGDSCDEINV